MTTLKYRSVTEVVAQGKLAADAVKKFDQFKCDDCYDIYKGRYALAIAEKDPEQQLILFLRCQQVGKIIITKSAQHKFHHKEELNKYQISLRDKIISSQNNLKERYAILQGPTVEQTLRKRIAELEKTMITLVQENTKIKGEFEAYKESVKRIQAANNVKPVAKKPVKK